MNAETLPCTGVRIHRGTCIGYAMGVSEGASASEPSAKAPRLGVPECRPAVDAGETATMDCAWQT